MAPQAWSTNTPNPTPDPAGYQVDDLTIELAPRRVRRAGTVIPLKALSFDLLVTLVRAAPNLLSFDQLSERVWSGLVITPETIVQRVKLLRGALGDDPHAPRYIEGVRGRGYRMVAEVHALTERQGTPESIVPPSNKETVAAIRAAIEKPSTPEPAIAGTPTADTRARASSPAGSDRSRYRVAIVVGALLAVVIGAFAAYRSWQPAHQAAALTTAAAPVGIPAAPAIPEKSVAVLPFVDMSEKKDQEYFSDGMSEELIDMLTKIPDLRVPARTSSFYFKGKQATIADIAKALNVAHVLEGSVRKSGKTLRITAQLIRVDNGYHVWSETYDRKLEDIFKVQDEIAGEVVTALKVSLHAGTIPDQTVTQNTDSYTLYLQARHLYQRGATMGDYESAIEYLTKALSLDPRFAPAWALRARARAASYAYFLNGSYEQVRRDAESDAKQALALDPTLPDPHLAMGAIHITIDWDWSAAEDEYSQALHLDPGNISALDGLSTIAIIQNRMDQAIQLAHSAILRDPLNHVSYYTLARAKSRLGQYAQAEMADRKALELNGTGYVNRFWVGYDLLMQGEPAAALREFERDRDDGIRRDGLLLALPALGRAQEAERIAGEMERASAATDAANLAAYYACQKDADRAFAWLDRAYSRRDSYILVTRGDFCFKNLEHDPRYKAFLRKLNLPE